MIILYRTVREKCVGVGGGGRRKKTGGGGGSEGNRKDWAELYGCIK